MFRKIIGILAIMLPFTAQAAWKSYEKVDDFTDIKETLAYVIGDNKANMMFSCKDKVLSLSIATGKYLGDSAKVDNFTYRVDKNKPVTMKLASRDSLAFTVESATAEKLAKDFSTGNEQLLIKLVDYRYTPSTAKFSLNNFKLTIEKVLNACQ